MCVCVRSSIETPESIEAFKQSLLGDQSFSQSRINYMVCNSDYGDDSNFSEDGFPELSSDPLMV